MGLFQDDPDLVVGFREGRREVLERVYRSYVRAVERYVRVLVRGSGSAEIGQASAVADLVQETFLKAFAPNARRAYDGLRPYEAYLATIARNCFLDLLRRRGREVPQDLDALSCQLEEGSTADESGDPRLLAVLNVYLQQLAASLKAVYEQRFVLGRSQAETCQALGISRRGLRTAEEHLRQSLRKALRREGIRLDDVSGGSDEIPAKATVRAVSRRGTS